MNGFEPIANLLAKVLPTSGERPVAFSQQTQLEHLWRTQLGLHSVSQHSWPLLFTSGRLVVFTESSAWGNEIRHQTHRIMSTLAQHNIQVNSVEAKTRPRAFTAPQKAYQRPKLSAKNAAQIKHMAQKIEHPGLQQALFSLAKCGEQAEHKDNPT